MEPIVLTMVVAIYLAAVLAPIAVYILARRSGHGLIWQLSILACAVVIWAALAVGFVYEALNLVVLSRLVEPAGFLGIIAFATLSVIAFTLAVKPWPRAGFELDRDTDDVDTPSFRLFATDFRD